MPEVSIIMPTYNRSDLIIPAIESVFHQDLTSWELLIIDDGSTDSTEEVLLPILNANQDKIKYVKKKNGGCASARNAGLDIARGEFICLLDSDDLFMPNKLALQVDLLKNDKTLGFVYSDAFEFDPLDGKLWLSRVANYGGVGDFHIEHFMTNHARSGALLYRKSVVRQIGHFRSDFKYNEDSHFLQEVSLIAKGCYSNYPSYIVRNHSGSKSRNLTELVEHELRSVELISVDYPDFRKANLNAILTRKIELNAKLFIVKLIALDISSAFEQLFRLGFGHTSYGIARLLVRRIGKLRNRISDRKIIKYYKKVIYDLI